MNQPRTGLDRSAKRGGTAGRLSGSDTKQAASETKAGPATEEPEGQLFPETTRPRTNQEKGRVGAKALNPEKPEEEASDTATDAKPPEAIPSDCERGGRDVPKEPEHPTKPHLTRRVDHHDKVQARAQTLEQPPRDPGALQEQAKAGKQTEQSCQRQRPGSGPSIPHKTQPRPNLRGNQIRLLPVHQEPKPNSAKSNAQKGKDNLRAKAQADSKEASTACRHTRQEAKKCETASHRNEAKSFNNADDTHTAKGNAPDPEAAPSSSTSNPSQSEVSSRRMKTCRAEANKLRVCKSYVIKAAEREGTCT
ncbi:neurofilament heavy polypeptide-like [Procambarus clarkii]|uniref:neurofilament heavy polypeptide-like n=1 Tax=Procambarus clarkii TaxID=6728 RepID=UPI003743037A